MSILSIDVGMKHLAICIINNACNNHKILAWEVVDLCNSDNKINCNFSLKNNCLCNKKAKYKKKLNYYCKTHAKKSNYPIPPSELNPKKIKNMKISQIKELDIYKNLNIVSSKKKDIIDEILLDLSQNYLNVIENVNCKSINFITYGKRLKTYFDELLTKYDIKQVLIENQIGPIAIRMKMLQGMIIQHFIENNILNIKEISASNKLKKYIPANKRTSYNERKKLSIDVTKNILKTNDNHKEWVTYFDKHSKKDDLADSYLQFLWFIPENIN